MKAINEELERIIKLNGITKRENILYGSNEAKVTGVSPTARGVKANFDDLQYFFFYFDEKGITLFPLYKDEYGLLPWENITEFKFKNLLFGSKMIIKTVNNTYKFEINTSVIGCPWVKENAKHLKEINYFYSK